MAERRGRDAIHHVEIGKKSGKGGELSEREERKQKRGRELQVFACAWREMCVCVCVCRCLQMQSKWVVMGTAVDRLPMDVGVGGHKRAVCDASTRKRKKKQGTQQNNMCAMLKWEK